MKPIVIWLTGLSGSGKTTIAKRLYQFYDGGTSTKAIIIDGDTLREESIEPLGFSIEDRNYNVNKAIYYASNAIQFKNVQYVIVALISPLIEMRDRARHILTKYYNARFIEVHMDTPLEICEQRDPKGLYKKARAGEIKNFTGIDSPYESPVLPELRIYPRTTLGEMTVDKTVDMIYNYIHN